MSRTRLSVDDHLLRPPGRERDRVEGKMREKGEGRRRDREDGENTEQKQQDPGRAMGRVQDPAVAHLRRVGVRDSATCTGSAGKRWSTRAPWERVGQC